MDLGLRDKIAFIAGSTRGIGLAIAEAFVKEGALVTITGREESSLKKATSELNALADAKVISIQGDMTDRTQVRESLRITADTYGGIDTVIANVGSGTAKNGWELGDEDWSSVLEMNLMGSAILAREAMPYLLKRDHASLTFISSIAGYETIGAPIVYSASKAAIDASMKSLSRLVGPNNVRVNAVSPGNVLFPGGSWEKKLEDRRDFFHEMINREVPLQRFGSPEEIANVVVFLASERASFVTGSCVVVDGGQTRSY